MSLLDNQLQQQTLFEVLKSNNSAVYGVVLNDHSSVAALSSQLDQPPYKAAPIAPVLYIKPKNTFAEDSAVITLPVNEDAVEIGATLAIILKKRATKASKEEAFSYIAGIGLVADLSLPHDSYYRPAVREKCFDGALPIADQMINVSQLDDIHALVINICINGQRVATRTFNELVRNTDQLLADVTDYMTLRAADVLLLGISYKAVQAKIGDTVNLSVEGHETTQVTFELKAGDLS